MWSLGGNKLPFSKIYLFDPLGIYNECYVVKQRRSFPKTRRTYKMRGEAPHKSSPEETKRIVVQAIAESKATTKKDLGQVMKAIMKLNSSIDGKLAKELADQLLAD